MRRMSLLLVALMSCFAATAGVQAFPSAVLLDADLRPIGELLTGTTQIRTFLDGRAAARTDVTEGDPLHV